MKLKHRLVSTILASVFATTSALPAATLPQLKSPPKTVNAPKVPAVKVPVAPKVPIVPKIVSAPKIPTVKVPTVKVPAAPKVPTTVKVPTVPKIPLVKEAPRLPKAPPAIVGKVPQAPKIQQTTSKTGASAPKAVKVKVPQATVAAATKSPAIPKGLTGNVSANIVREAVKGAQSDNEDRGPNGGPAAKFVPSLDKDGDKNRGAELAGKVRGRVTMDDASKQSRIEALRGGGKSNEELAAAAAISQINTGKTDKPQFDQGFASRPDLSGFNGDFGNPMTGISNGGSIGGLLGAAADKAGNGTPGGLAGLGTSLISDGGAASSGGQATYDDDEGVKGRGSNKGLLDLLKDRFGVSEKQANETVKATVGIGNNRNGSEFLNDANGDPAPATKPAGGTPAPEPAEPKTKTSSDGRNTVVTDADGTKHVYVDGSKVGTIAPDGTATPTPAKSVGQPDPENEGGTKVDVISQSSSLLQQIGQSRSGKKGSQGGNGDMTPTEDGISGVANGVVINQQGTLAAKNNLLGNPGQNGGLREGGTAHAPVRSNGSGVITPTNDQNMSSSGGRQEDPGAFFDNGVGADTSRLNNNGDTEDESSSKDTK